MTEDAEPLGEILEGVLGNDATEIHGGVRSHQLSECGKSDSGGRILAPYGAGGGQDSQNAVGRLGG